MRKTAVRFLAVWLFISSTGTLWGLTSQFSGWRCHHRFAQRLSRRCPCEDPLWWSVQAPDDPQIRECLQNIECQVYFPPVEAMSRRALIEMMIIVPPISKCEYSQKDIVSTLVRAFKPARAEKMSKGVDAVDSMVNEHRAYKKAPRQHLKT